MSAPPDPAAGSALVPTGASAPTPASTRKTVVVTPDQVWADPARASAAPVGPEPARQTFFAPIAMVLALSSGLLAVFLAALLLLWLRR